ncbi:hypothetical protein AVEN_46550-1 [Araneus ventricosus]|uniref:Uncharacterized protein n=1 Tax=Araneus ventricosus TaxID=182803 RepID=A0A4Y2JZU1_ARAVE|nr:hypothetical protein AVEN_46550-1 [Araneus ventricosus]
MDLVCTRQAYGSSSMELGLEPFGPEAGIPTFNLSQHKSGRAYGSERISCAPDALIAFLRWHWVSNHSAPEAGTPIYRLPQNTIGKAYYSEWI